MPSAAFSRFWRTDLTRDLFLSFTTQDDLKSLRLVSTDFAVQAAPALFADVHVTFNTNAFSRRVRMSALERLGHHIKKLTFHMAHGANTFLPPLIDPDTGLEKHFVYKPLIHPLSRPSSASSSSSYSKYGSSEMTDLLIRQYPPLFHAATNIANFHRFVTVLPNLRHVHISCPGQQAEHRYRRSCIDYALISLRVALEAYAPPMLKQLTLSPIHPGALWYLRATPFSFGSTPAATKLWRCVEKLDMSIQSFPRTYSDKADHLKLLQSYLSTFPLLRTLRFAWLGTKEPSPLSLHLEPHITDQPISEMLKDDSTESPAKWPTLPIKSSAAPLRFRKLKILHISNATMDAPCTAAFITTHREVLDEVDFHECEVRGEGTWEEALAPLLKKKRKSRSDRTVDSSSSESARSQPGRTKLKHRSREKTPPVEVMEVPIMLTQPITQANQELILDMMWKNVARESGPGWGASGLRLLRAASLRTRQLWEWGSGRRKCNSRHGGL